MTLLTEGDLQNLILGSKLALLIDVPHKRWQYMMKTLKTGYWPALPFRIEPRQSALVSEFASEAGGLWKRNTCDASIAHEPSDQDELGREVEATCSMIDIQDKLREVGLCVTDGVKDSMCCAA